MLHAQVFWWAVSFGYEWISAWTERLFTFICVLPSPLILKLEFPVISMKKVAPFFLNRACEHKVNLRNIKSSSKQSEYFGITSRLQDLVQKTFIDTSLSKCTVL